MSVRVVKLPDIERALEKLRDAEAEVVFDFGDYLHAAELRDELVELMDAVRTMSLGIDRNPTIDRTYAALHALAQRVNGE